MVKVAYLGTLILLKKFTHVLQIDGDGQCDPNTLSPYLEILISRLFMVIDI